MPAADSFEIVGVTPLDALATQLQSGCDRGSRAARQSELMPCRDGAAARMKASPQPFRWADWTSRIERLGAPRENGGKLIEPSADNIAAMVAATRSAVCYSDYDVQGRSLCQLAAEAREQLLVAATSYTRSYRDVATPEPAAAFFLAGHQPEMFHPGVWLKNFELNRLAKIHGAVAINLQIDSDAMKSSSLRVPVGSLEETRHEAVPFDRGSSNLPFEQRPILDRAMFESFGDRATRQLQPFIQEPLLKEYWPMVVARSRQSNNVGASISQARHQLEGQWGLQTIEIPQSQVCDLPAFRAFVAHLLAHLPRFWDIYNSALLEYRHEHKVRSSAHPVPELESEDGWLEAPLWIWSNENPVRRALFVRQRNEELVLSDRAGIEATISITPEGNTDLAVEQLAVLSARGIRLRTRALITTLAARLLLGDLFMHGIGGAKYDQLTDRIIERFFGVEPTGYMCVSGTLRLPLAAPARSADDARRHRRCIRELQFHPERFVDETLIAKLGPAAAEARHWVGEKQRWVRVEETPQNARERCRAIRRANESLQPFLNDLRQTWKARADQLAKIQRAETVLGSREFGFPLFPKLTLTEFLQPILENSLTTE